MPRPAALLRSQRMMKNARSKTPAGALTIALVYAICGGLWILLSDRVLGRLIRDPADFVNASIGNGWFYIGLTTLLVYVLVRQFANRISAANQREIALERERMQPNPMLIAIADASIDAIYAKDEAGRYLLFNNALARLLGKSSEEVIGRDDYLVFPADQAERIMAVERRIRESGETNTSEDLLTTVEGDKVFCSTRGALRGADGRIFGTYGISRDETERKRVETKLRESQVRLRLLINHAPAALAMFDREMRYLVASPRWVSVYIGSEKEFVGRSHYEMDSDLPESWSTAHARGMSGETVSAEEDLYQRRDGRQSWVRWEVRPWYDDAGAIGGIVVFAEDVTRRKAAEMEIKQRNQELERFNSAAVERELRMVALKREVNEMAHAAGHPAPYDLTREVEYGGQPAP